MFDLPLHMARDQIEESLRTKMASIKVDWVVILAKWLRYAIEQLCVMIMAVKCYCVSNLKERMVQLQDAQKGSEVTSEVTERELELEAQLVEARSIIQEQVSFCFLQTHVIALGCCLKWNLVATPSKWTVKLIQYISMLHKVRKFFTVYFLQFPFFCLQLPMRFSDCNSLTS